MYSHSSQGCGFQVLYIHILSMFTLVIFDYIDSIHVVCDLAVERLKHYFDILPMFL